MIKNNIYCQVSGMVMQCIADLGGDLPSVCEIGCADGQGIARYGGFCSQVVAIDPMKHGRDDIVSYEKEYIDIDQDKLDVFCKNISHIKHHVKLVVGCSAWKETVEEVETYAPFDILVIDGCHHPFDAVLKDFELYHDFVKVGGIVIFDDLYEDCVLKVYELAQEKFEYTEHERFLLKGKYLNFPSVLQDVGALKKTK